MYLISQRRSTDYVSFISLILLPRPTHKSRKGKIRICRVFGHASFRCIYICLFHDDSFGFNIWHYLHHLLVHLFVSNGRTLSGSPLGDNLSRAKAALMLTMSIRLYPIHYASPFYLHFVQILTVIYSKNLTFIANYGVNNEHYKEPVIPIHSRQLGANQRGGEGGSFSCIALIGWGLMPSDKALHPPSLPTYSFPRYSWTVIPD